MCICNHFSTRQRGERGHCAVQPPDLCLDKSAKHLENIFCKVGTQRVSSIESLVHRKSIDWQPDGGPRWHGDARGRWLWNGERIALDRSQVMIFHYDDYCEETRIGYKMGQSRYGDSLNAEWDNIEPKQRLWRQGIESHPGPIYDDNDDDDEDLENKLCSRNIGGRVQKWHNRHPRSQTGRN